MIDTLKFKIPIDETMLQNIISKTQFFGSEHQKNEPAGKEDELEELGVATPYVDFLGERHFRYGTTTIEVGKYKTPLTVLLYKRGFWVFIEYSMPKQHNGENVHLLYPNQIVTTLKELYQTLWNYYGIFPHYKEWQIQRLDLCYAWKFKTHEEGLKVLYILTLLRYPKKSIYIYPKESLGFFGRTFTIKFYMKEPELKKKDYPILIKNGFIDLANKTLELSKNVLRYEITMRKSYLNQVFNHKLKKIFTYEDILDINFFYQHLNNGLNVLFGGLDKQMMNDLRVFELLIDKYKKDKAVRLFNFYRGYYSSENHIKHIFDMSYNSTTIKRYLEALQEANVGISNHNTEFFIDLSIPNKLEVNLTETTPALAGGV